MTTKKTPQHILDKKKEYYNCLSDEEKIRRNNQKKEYYAYNLEKITEKYKEKYAETILCECGLEIHIPYINKHKKTLKHIREINRQKRNIKYHKEVIALINASASSNEQYTITKGNSESYTL